MVKSILKNIISILLIACLFSCKRKKCTLPITEIKLINKAEHSFGGKKDLLIIDKDKIAKIENFLEQLQSDVTNDISVQFNYGFVEVLCSTNDCKNIEYFNVVFSEDSGDLIHYNYDDDNYYEYFDSKEFVDFIKTEMKMSKKRILE